MFFSLSSGLVFLWEQPPQYGKFCLFSAEIRAYNPCIQIRGCLDTVIKVIFVSFSSISGVRWQTGVCLSRLSMIWRRVQKSSAAGWPLVSDDSSLHNCLVVSERLVKVSCYVNSSHLLFTALHEVRLQGTAQKLASVRLSLDQWNGTAHSGQQTHQIQVRASSVCFPCLTHWYINNHRIMKISVPWFFKCNNVISHFLPQHGEEDGQVEHHWTWHVSATSDT